MSQASGRGCSLFSVVQIDPRRNIGAYADGATWVEIDMLAEACSISSVISAVIFRVVEEVSVRGANVVDESESEILVWKNFVVKVLQWSEYRP